MDERNNMKNTSGLTLNDYPRLKNEIDKLCSATFYGKETSETEKNLFKQEVYEIFRKFVETQGKNDNEKKGFLKGMFTRKEKTPLEELNKKIYDAYKNDISRDVHYGATHDGAIRGFRNRLMEAYWLDSQDLKKTPAQKYREGLQEGVNKIDTVKAREAADAKAQRKDKENEKEEENTNDLTQ